MRSPTEQEKALFIQQQRLRREDFAYAYTQFLERTGRIFKNNTSNVFLITMDPESTWLCEFSLGLKKDLKSLGLTAEITTADKLMAEDCPRGCTVFVGQENPNSASHLMPEKYTIVGSTQKLTSYLDYLLATLSFTHNTSPELNPELIQLKLDFQNAHRSMIPWLKELSSQQTAAYPPINEWKDISEETFLKCDLACSPSLGHTQSGPAFFDTQSNPIICVLPNGNPDFFVPREEYSNKLREKLSQPKEVIQEVFGLSGNGKTSLILDLAYQFKKNYRLVYWFDGRHNFDEQYRALAIKINETKRLKPIAVGKNKSLGSIRTHVQAALKNFQPFLLIVDNILDHGDFRKYFQTGDPDIRGHFLISAQISGQYPNRFEVGFLTQPEALALTRKRLDSCYSDDCALLVNTVGLCALVLVQSATYLNQFGNMKVSKYIEDFQERHAELQAKQKDLPIQFPAPYGGYPFSVQTAFDLSFEALKNTTSQENFEVARDLLVICSLLDTTQIPEYFIIKWLEKIKPNHNDPDGVILLLQKIHFLKGHTSGLSEHFKNLYSMHDAIQKYAYDIFLEMGAEKKRYLVDATIDSFLCVFKEIKKEIKIPILTLMRGNAENFRQKTEHFNMQTEKYAEFLALMVNIGNDISVGFDQMPLYEKTLSLYQDFSGKDPTNQRLAKEVGIHMIRLAHAHRVNGKTEEAEKIYNESKIHLESLLKKPGEHEIKFSELSESEKGSHLEISSALNGLALAAIKKNDFKSAAEHFEQALEIRKYHADTHPGYIGTTLLNLGYVYMTNNQKDEAIAHYEESIAYFNKPDDNDQSLNLIHVRTRLGECYNKFDELDEAESELQKALETCKKIKLDEEHQAFIKAKSLLNGVIQKREQRQSTLRP